MPQSKTISLILNTQIQSFLQNNKKGSLSAYVLYQEIPHNCVLFKLFFWHQGRFNKFVKKQDADCTWICPVLPLYQAVTQFLRGETWKMMLFAIPLFATLYNFRFIWASYKCEPIETKMQQWEIFILLQWQIKECLHRILHKDWR